MVTSKPHAIPRPTSRILALVIDFSPSDSGAAEAQRLTIQIAQSRGDHALSVVHVDNGNASPRALSPEQAARGVRLLRLPRNRGYGAGIEGALRQLESEGERWDLAWFLNADLEVEPDCLERLTQVLRDQPRVGAIGPTVYWGEDRARVWGARGVVSPWLGITAMVRWSGGALPKWSYVPGAAILVRAEAYREAGRMPLRYRMYFEETHLCVQMQRQGWKLWIEPSARAYHHVRSQVAAMPAKHFAFYFARNNLYFWKTCFGIPAWVQLPRTLFVVFKELVLPLRRAPNLRALGANLSWTYAGFRDGFSFLKNETTPRERVLFPELTEPEGARRKP